MTQTRLADLLGHNPRAIRAWASGAYPMPQSAATVVGLLERGKITVADFEAAAD